MHRYLLLRRTTQVGILVLFWLGAKGHLGVLTGNLSSSRLLGTIPMSDPYAVLQILATGQPLASTVLVGALVVLAFYAVVGGRVFCGWVCPVDLVRGASHWLKQRFAFGGQFRVDRSTRYWVMVLGVLLSSLLGVAAFEWVSPIGMIHRELIYGPGLGLMMIGVIAGIDLWLVKDGWCGALCPLGAFYSLLGRLARVRVGFDASRRDHCGDCVPACPENHVIDFGWMKERGFIDSGDCMGCGRCLDVCPQSAYRFTLRPSNGSSAQSKKGDGHAIQTAA
jgi:ferredoxin-type protein NapH